MKKLTIRQAILDAIDETDEQLGRYPNQVMKWAKYIEKEIGTILAYPIKSVLFTVTGSMIDLPDDCYRVRDMLMGDHTGEPNAQYLDERYPLLQIDNRYNAEPLDQVEYVWEPEDRVHVHPMMWEEIGEQLQLVRMFNDQQVTLIYEYIPVDDNGYWLVNESHIDPIKKFIIYKFACKFRWKIFKSDKLLRSGHLQTVQILQRDYSHAIRNARANDAAESEFERIQY